MRRTHGILAIVSAVLGLGAAGADFGPPIERNRISAIDLAERIMARDSKLQVFDLRAPGAFEELHIPTARHAAIDDIALQQIPQDSTIVLYSEGAPLTDQAWALLRM